MKIGLVTGEFPPMQGGVGAFTQELARAFDAAGHEVHIVTSRDARPANHKRSLTGGKDPDDLGFAQLHAHIGRWRWPSLDAVADVVLRHELDVLNLQYQPAAFNMNSAAINFLPWRLKQVTTTIVTFHDLRVPYLFPKAGPLRRRAVDFLTRQAHGIITTNTVDFARVQQITDRPVAQIPIGSNIQTYALNHVEVAEVRTQLGLADNDHLLGYFGFLNESKGADTLLQALALLDEQYHLVFIGGQTGASDPTNERFLAQMRALSAALDLEQRVHWTGFLSDERVAAHLHAAEMIVLPYKDGVSLRRGTLMAALANGRPVITTAPQVPEPALQNSAAMQLVPPDDPAALAVSIRDLAGDAARLESLSAGALALAHAFSWDNIAARSLAFFQQCINSRG
jgi:glycosyltransferase involved in cell wall biosynthesis